MYIYIFIATFKNCPSCFDKATDLAAWIPPSTMSNYRVSLRQADLQSGWETCLETPFGRVVNPYKH